MDSFSMLGRRVAAATELEFLRRPVNMDSGGKHEKKMSPVLAFDTASALDPGGREYQEDALISDFSSDADVGLVILADGMGGHAAGDVASTIVVSEVHSVLKRYATSAKEFEATVVDQLHTAALTANRAIEAHVGAHPETEGMGATLVACAIVNGSLYRMSIGDSPLFLFRDGHLQQLNEDHSMAPQIDFMVDAGLMDAEEARHHPDRNALTSVLNGLEISKVDCPDDPLLLREGDIVIVASDGLQYLNNDAIEAIIRQSRSADSASITENLMASVTSLDEPDLDNISISVLKVKAQPGAIPARGTSFLNRFRKLVFDKG